MDRLRVDLHLDGAHDVVGGGWVWYSPCYRRSAQQVRVAVPRPMPLHDGGVYMLDWFLKANGIQLSTF